MTEIVRRIKNSMRNELFSCFLGWIYVNDNGGAGNNKKWILQMAVFTLTNFDDKEVAFSTETLSCVTEFSFVAGDASCPSMYKHVKACVFSGSDNHPIHVKETVGEVAEKANAAIRLTRNTL